MASFSVFRQSNGLHSPPGLVKLFLLAISAHAEACISMLSLPSEGTATQIAFRHADLKVTSAIVFKLNTAVKSRELLFNTKMKICDYNSALRITLRYFW